MVIRLLFVLVECFNISVTSIRHHHHIFLASEVRGGLVIFILAWPTRAPYPEFVRIGTWFDRRTSGE